MDIVEWLRSFRIFPSNSDYNAKVVNTRLDEAADEIEQRRKTSQFHKDRWLAAEAEIERLRAALDQALDDMGANGMSVCEAAKAQMRYALGRNVDPEFDYYPLDRAISVLVSLGQFKSEEQAYKALEEKE